MSRTIIHKDKAKFKQGFELTEKYARQCDRRNSERGYFKNVKNKKKEIIFKSVTKEEREKYRNPSIEYIL